VTSEDAAALLYLRSLWQEAYAITVSEGVWTARRHDNTDRVLSADTSLDLRWQIRTDYGEWLCTRS
jgi:hypothetical protein